VLDLDVGGEDGGKVTMSGPDVRITGTRKLPLTGKRAAVAFRPEEANLVEPGLATNAIAGRVVNVEYCGRDSLIDVKTPGGTLLHVRSVRQPALDDSVAVQVPVERALVYPAE